MPISPRQLTASLLAADHIAERQMIAAFVAHPATQPAPNPFPETCVGAVSQVWRQRAAEFQSFAVEAAGLTCLLATLSVSARWQAPCGIRSWTWIQCCREGLYPPYVWTYDLAPYRRSRHASLVDA